MMSPIFRMFLEKYPTSKPMEEWRKWGDTIPDHSGSFTTNLYKGDILEAIGCADMQNKAMLKALLFPCADKYHEVDEM